MCRNFLPDLLPQELLTQLLDDARRAPSAGFAQGVEFCVVQPPHRYWELSLPPQRRAGFPWPGLLNAPVLVVVLVEPERYVRRYAEPDKTDHGLGETAEDWPVPYWWVDAGMVVQNLLLSAEAAGLGACFFGLFEHEQAVLAGLGVPSGRRAAGTVALGRPAAGETSRGSAARERRPMGEIVYLAGS